jgi:hypothetical protein
VSNGDPLRRAEELEDLSGVVDVFGGRDHIDVVGDVVRIDAIHLQQLRVCNVDLAHLPDPAIARRQADRDV